MPSFGGGSKIGKVDAITGEGRILGLIGQSGSLADLLNKRGLIPLSDAQIGPVTGSLAPTPQAEIDPYDTILIGAAAGGSPVIQPTERSEMSRLRDAYDAVYEAGPIRVSGVIYPLPGHNPMDTLDQGVDVAIPIFDLSVTCSGARLSFTSDAALVGRPNVKVVSAQKRR